MKPASALRELHALIVAAENDGRVREAEALHKAFVRLADWDDEDGWDDEEIDEARDRIFNPKGEWWIANGMAEFADGDVGDVNHEMIAEGEILGRLGYNLNNEEWPASTETAWDDWKRMRQGDYGHGWDAAKREDDWNRFVEWAEAEHGPENFDYLDYEDYIRWMHAHGLPEEQRLSPEEVQLHLKGLKDPRGHAIEHFGWAAVRNNDVEVWDLSPDSLRNLASGLQDAYGEDVDSMKFNVEIRKLGKYFMGIPFSEIADGSIRQRLREMPTLPVAALPNRRMEYKNPYENDPIEGIRRMYRYPGASALTEIHRVANALEESGMVDAAHLLHDVFLRVAGKKRNHGGLDDWFQEKWIDVRRPQKDGKGYEPCGRGDTKDGKKPVCTPANKAKNLTKRERTQRMKEKAKKEQEPNPDKKPNTTQYSEGAGGKSNVS